jgi:hypothetical protein
MDHGHSMIGFIVIVILYATIGLMAAAGAIFVVRKFLAPKAEQIFYAMFLIMIAAFYLAFAAYFGAWEAWRMETAAVLAFVAIGVLGARLPFVLIVGYSLHGLWDLLHELQAHGAYSAFEPGRLTAIPLAYGIFCAAFDFSIAAYAYARRAEWNAAWKSVA